MAVALVPAAVEAVYPSAEAVASPAVAMEAAAVKGRSVKKQK